MKQKNRGAVLISIQPRWCELIANGKKTVEVRKTKPKLETPFKVYIYCTNSEDMLWILRENERNSEKIASIFTAKDVGGATKANGKVIGEFLCDNIAKGNSQLGSCLTMREISEYAKGKAVYGWHISDLVIYDKPKELSEFKKINRECWYADLGLQKRDCPECQNKGCFVQRPPQSWCYVEKGGGSGA